MAGDGWQHVTIDAIKAKSRTAIAIGPFGSRMKSDRYMPVGIPVIRGNNISNTQELVGDFVYVAPETADELCTSNVFPDDLIFPHRGAIGLVGIVPRGKQKRYILSTSLMKLTCDKSIVDPRFVFYFFRSPNGQHELLKHASTVGTPGIGQPLASLRSIPIALPPLDEQRAIARILSALDDKIELNRRMNETLEAMARALFKSWFVDFDPVRAKAEGRDPGLPKPIADLFPARLVDSELGEIPGGWQLCSLSKVCSAIFSGGTPNTARPEYWEGNIPWLSSGETRSKFIVSTEKSISAEGVSNSSTRLARAGATVIASAGQGHTRGQASMLMFDSYINQSVVALRMDTKFTSNTHLFFDLERRYEQFRQLSDAHSSRGSLTTRLLADLPIVAPPRDLIHAFDRIAAPSVRKISITLEESRALTAVRDALLPNLISGGLRVRDAERVVAEVAA